MAEPTITLDFIAEQQRRTLDELAGMRVEMAAMRTEFVAMRDDIMVLTAIVTRQENTQKAILDQLRAMTTQQYRFAERLREREEQRDERP